MEEGGPSRTAEGEKKLIAAFVTGVVGYSPLMGDGHDAPAKDPRGNPQGILFPYPAVRGPSRERPRGLHPGNAG